MDIENVKQLINEVISDDKTKTFIKEKIEESAEKKAKLLFDQEKDELEEEYNARLKSETRKIKNELCEKYEKIILEKIESINNVLSRYVDETVSEFIDNYKNQFKKLKNSAKVDAVLESLAGTLSLAGVNVQTIFEGARNVKNQEVVDLEERVKVLKAQLQNEHSVKNQEVVDLEERVKVLKAQLQNEQQTIKDLQDNELVSLKKTIDEMKTSENTKIANLKNALVQESKEKSLIEKKCKDLSTENNRIMQMGIISELKKDLTLSESQKFENCAMSIPFSLNKNYISQLKTLKESIQDTSPLNEVYPEEGEHDEHDDDIPDSIKKFI
jgi:hypothetical protein